MAIAFVNAGTYVPTTGASVTPAMPASPAANNCLIAYCSYANNSVASVSGAGWTLGGQTNGNQSMAWAWAVFSTQTAPTFNWTGSVACVGQVLQFSGTLTPTPTGSSQSNNGTGTTISVTGVTTTANNSMIWANLTASVSQTIPTPKGGFTSLGTAIGSPSAINLDGFVGISGQTSTAISTNITSANWAGLSVELVGSGASTTGNMRDTQDTIQVLETYSNATNMRDTQVVQQVLETYSNPTNMRDTQVTLQILRSQLLLTGNRQRWKAGAGVGLTWTDIFSTATLNSIANGNAILSDLAIVNGTALDLYMDVSLALASAAFVAPNVTHFYLYPLNQDGTTYGDGRFGSSAAGPPSAWYWCGQIGLVAATQSQTGTLCRIIIPPGTFKLVFYNQGGVALASSGNTCQYRTYDRQIG